MHDVADWLGLAHAGALFLWSSVSAMIGTLVGVRLNEAATRRNAREQEAIRLASQLHVERLKAYQEIAPLTERFVLEAMQNALWIFTEKEPSKWKTDFTVAGELTMALIKHGIILPEEVVERVTDLAREAAAAYSLAEKGIEDPFASLDQHGRRLRERVIAVTSEMRLSIREKALKTTLYDLIPLPPEKSGKDHAADRLKE